MYLRQPNKWNEFLLAEAIENIGLPSRVVTWIRRRAAFTADGDSHAETLAQQQGVELQKIDEKHLTWLGQLLKKFNMRLYSVSDARHLAHFIKKAVRETSGIDASSSEEEREALGERIVDAIGPIIDWATDLNPGPAPEELHTLADMKGLRKRMVRALKRADLPLPEIKTAEVIFDKSVFDNLHADTGLHTTLRKILTVLALDPVYYEEELKAAKTLRIAYRLASEFLDSPKKEEDKVIHEFDNGYYWYDIQSYACDFEGKQMGHCGRGEQGSLVSLRAGGGRKMKPFITLEFDGDTLYQIKGKGNAAPKEDLWPYVDWFIENMGVERITETGQHSGDPESFDRLLAHIAKTHPDLKMKESWFAEADELLDQFEPTIETDSQTFLELDRASEGTTGEVGVILRHQAFWPVKDIIVDEDTHRLRWEIRQDAASIADTTLYPNPRIRTVDVFARGVQDSEAAMLRVEMIWEDNFEPTDLEDEEEVKQELGLLVEYLDDIQHIAGWLTSPDAAPEDAEFDYNGFFEGVMKRLEEYGVYRDIAGEIDAADARAPDDDDWWDDDEEQRSFPSTRQMDLPLSESRIIQRWSKIIK